MRSQRIHRAFLASLLSMLGSCARYAEHQVRPRVEQRAPRAVVTGLTPALVLQSALNSLRDQGFQPSSYNLITGTIVAGRFRPPGGNEDLLECRWTPSARANGKGHTLITLTLVARSIEATALYASPVTLVQVQSAVDVWFLNATDQPRMPADPTLCASNGMAERTLMAAIRS